MKRRICVHLPSIPETLLYAAGWNACYHPRKKTIEVERVEYFWPGEYRVTGRVELPVEEEPESSEDLENMVAEKLGLRKVLPKDPLSQVTYYVEGGE